MMKKMAALLLGALLSVNLIGCGAGTTTTQQTQVVTEAGTVQQEEIVESEETMAEETADNSVTLDGSLVIAKQGMFSAGGTVVTSDGTFDVSNYYTSREGSTSHVDHANVLYQIPEDESELPMVFLHGYGQSRMGWMTTPDGREGWSDMFLRMGHSVFLIDQPRRGEAGQTSVAGTISTDPSDQTWYTQFRIGTYIDGEFTYNENSQFPEGEDALDQFFRQMTPDTGMDSANGDQSIDNEVVAQAVAAAIDEVYEMTGKDSILVTHSQGGRPGWDTAIYTDHIAAIIAIEPGSATDVGSEAYNALLEKNIPIAFYYGDYIGEEYTDVPAAAMWAGMAATADTFTESYTSEGGVSTIYHLPDEGIYGNDHFIFQDVNNDVIAAHVENWVQENVD
ncbi:MAG: alpha/beta fold hydrolase [Clostridiales bacterium]|nr:alpha/beta fold hydrolase [Clostridiales bacterium]